MAGLRLVDVDLPSLILARNDSHPDGDWWFDPRSGRSLYYGVDDDTDLPALVAGVHVLIPYAPQPREDIEDFLVQAVSSGVDEAAVTRLWDAYRGRGGARRFRALVGSTEAADAWTRFTIDRESARAVHWLVERGLLQPEG